jgi:hypothetical protein
VMAMIQPFQDRGELASHSLVQAKAEHLREFVGGEAEQSEVARSKSLWIGKLRRKMKFRQYSTCCRE